MQNARNWLLIPSIHKSHDGINPLRLRDKLQKKDNRDIFYYVLIVFNN